MAIKVSGTEVISDDKRILNNESLPDIRPSLLLDFANSKTLDPRITFTRGSTATYWDGKTTAKAEENLLKYSQEFDNAAWGKGASTTLTSGSTAPDGTSTAYRLEMPNTVGGTFVSQYVNTVSGQQYTVSIYAKENGTGSYFRFNTGGGASSDTAVTSEWVRYEFTFTAASASTLVEIDNTVTADTDILIWGAQLEQRSSATAYTATTSSPIVKYQPVLQTAASGEARFDHDPVTGESKGLLIEEARTNLFPYDNPSASAWYKNESTITANALTAPDGTTTASKLVENTANAVHYTSETITVSGDTRYTMSVFAKAGEKNFLKLQCGFVSNWVLAHDIIFDLSDGSLHDSSSAESVEGTDFGSYDMGNGWYRLWISGTTISSATAAGFNLHLATGVGNQVLYTGDGYSGVFVWGAQMEEGSFPTSYIPTSGSTVTRAQDDADVTGTNFSQWFNPTEGTILTDFNYNYSESGSGYPRIWSITEDGSIQNRMGVLINETANGITQELYSFNTGQVSIAYQLSNLTGSATAKSSFAYAEDNFGVSVNGSLGTDTSGSMATSQARASLRLGGLTTGGGDHRQAWIKKWAYYPKRLPNATLQAMTEA